MDELRLRKVKGLLGLAAKAGAVRSGAYGVEESLKKGKARLCVLAEDAAVKTKESVTALCGRQKIPLYEIADMESLGHTIGKDARAALTVEEKGLAEAIGALLEGGNADGK